MPELHRLTPPMGVLQKRGFKVALVTDGRMSGASGRVPAAIHLTPEAFKGGLIGKVNTGDMIEINTVTGDMTLHVSEAELAKREQATLDLTQSHQGMGRELFAAMRLSLTGAEEGACSLFVEQDRLDSGSL
jgi:phosphogluconate dehydratase